MSRWGTAIRLPGRAPSRLREAAYLAGGVSAFIVALALGLGGVTAPITIVAAYAALGVAELAWRRRRDRQGAGD
jgi:hypothetical protein